MRIRTAVHPLLLLAGPLVAGTPAQTSQQPDVVLRQNDLIPNLGSLSQIIQTVVNDRGDFATEVQGDGSSLRYILRNGFPTFVAGVTLPQPNGFRVRTNHRFDDLSINQNVTFSWPLNIEDLAGTFSSRTLALYVNVSLLHTVGDNLSASIIDPDGANLTSFTYDDFSFAFINDLNQVFWFGRITDGTNVDTVLGRIDTDGFGAIESERILLRTGMSYDGTTIRFLGVRGNNVAISNRGDWISTVQLAGRPQRADTHIVYNGTSVAIEGQPSPFPGFDWDNHLTARVGVNDLGDYLFTTNVQTGTLTEVLVKNGTEIISAEGSLALGLASIAPDIIDGYGPPAGPKVKVANSGDVFWFGDLTGAGQRNRAYFRNQEVLFRENDTLPNGNTIRTINNSSLVFDSSPSGRYWIGQAQFTAGGDQALVMYDFGLTLNRPGSGVNPGTLKKIGGDARVGSLIEFELGNPQGDGVIPFLFLSTQPAIPGSPFGTMTPYGELLIDPSPGVLVGTFREAPVVGGIANFKLQIPPDTSLMEQEGWIQGLFLDANNTAPGENIRLTNGYYLQLGAP